MRIICDAPGQTCNRLWTYVPSVAKCIAEHKKMAIIFFDWTIEDFPNLLHSIYIFFPLYHKWFFDISKGWGWYKHLTWKVTHNKKWDAIFHLFGFKKGWDTMQDYRYINHTKKELQHIFCPKKDITDRAEALISEIREQADIVIGVHIRHGDYKIWRNGRHYYTLEEFHHFMLMTKELFNKKRVSFFISSNEEFSLEVFTDCTCFRFNNETSGDILDLHTLSLCDRIIGPWSTYSRWASFIGEVPLCFIKDRNQIIQHKDFSIVTDFYHFQNGESTEDYWRNCI